MACVPDAEDEAHAPAPTCLPDLRGEIIISDCLAVDAIYRVLSRPGDWSADTLTEIAEIVVATGRELMEAADIAVELLEDARGWPIAHIQADKVTGYIRQVPDGGMCVDVHTRDGQARETLRVLIDGQSVHGPTLLSGSAEDTR